MHAEYLHLQSASCVHVYALHNLYITLYSVYQYINDIAIARGFSDGQNDGYH